AHHRVVEPLVIHLFRLDRLGYGIQVFVTLPEARLGLGKLDPLLHEFLAVDILVVESIDADEFLVGAMREHYPIHPVHHDIEVVVDERTFRVADLGTFSPPSVLMAATAFLTMATASSLVAPAASAALNKATTTTVSAAPRHLFTRTLLSHSSPVFPHAF